MANTSGSAGVISSQVAKPANVAPSTQTESIVEAGTSFDRVVPNRSEYETRK